MTWERATLKELCLKVVKLDPATTGRKRIRYIDIGGVDGDLHRLKEVPEIDSVGAPSRCRQLVATGDTVFSTVRPYLEKVAYVDNSLDGQFASTGFSVLRPGPRLIPRFLHYFTTSQEMFDQVLPFQKGMSYPAVLDREVRSVLMPVPPLEEQRRIVAILEDHLSRLDAAESSLRMAKNRCRSLIASTGARIVRRALEEGQIEQLGTHAEAVQYGTSAKCHEVQTENDVPVLRMGNIQDSKVDWNGLKFLDRDHSDLPKLLISRGDLLFNRTNSAELVGKSAVVESDVAASFASYLIRVRFRETVNPHWVNLVINSPQGRDYIASCTSQQVGQANVNGKKLRAFPIPIVSIERQAQLVREFDHAVIASKRAIQAADLIARRSLALRRSLLSAAFAVSIWSFEHRHYCR